MAINQLWISDIRYFVIGNGFGYWSLVTDAFSRKITGQHLNGDLKAEGSIQSLQMAISQLTEKNKTIHHSGRGIQYC